MLAATSSAKRLSNIKILVLDGSPKAASVLKDMFSKLGLSSVQTANDGFEGVQCMRKVRFDLVFTDAELRVQRRKKPLDGKSEEKEEGEAVPINGVHFVERLRRARTSPNPYVPIVMLVDMIANTNLASVRDAGVNEILQKPVNADEFCQKIMTLIDSPRAFITAESYRGPCRRREALGPPEGSEERRVRQVRLVRRNEYS